MSFKPPLWAVFLCLTFGSGSKMAAVWQQTFFAAIFHHGLSAHPYPRTLLPCINLHFGIPQLQARVENSRPGRSRTEKENRCVQAVVSGISASV